jgi:hypothetical protein
MLSYYRQRQFTVPNSPRVETGYNTYIAALRVVRGDKEETQYQVRR